MIIDLLKVMGFSAVIAVFCILIKILYDYLMNKLFRKMDDVEFINFMKNKRFSSYSDISEYARRNWFFITPVRVCRESWIINNNGYPEEFVLVDKFRNKGDRIDLHFKYDYGYGVVDYPPTEEDLNANDWRFFEVTYKNVLYNLIDGTKIKH